MGEQTPVIKKGSKGEAVRRFQEGLQLLGWDIGGVDGIFGSKTETAVREFQHNNDLTADGIVGPKTWKAFEDALDAAFPS